ncbi:hypothetical protein Tco_0269466 [Tanacetum coccineum]
MSELRADRVGRNPQRATKWSVWQRVYSSDSEGFDMNPSSNEFRLCNSDGWRSGNHGGRVIIHGYGGLPWIKGVFGSSDHKILTNPFSSPLISMIVIDQVCEDMKFPGLLRGIYKVKFAWDQAKLVCGRFWGQIHVFTMSD